MKTKRDFQLDPDLNPDDWIVSGWIPSSGRVLDAGFEGSFKTVLGTWICICVAAGLPIFGMDVMQGYVLMIDNDSPPGLLKKLINRFCLGLNLELKNLPLMVENPSSYRFGNKPELTRIIDKYIKPYKPVLIRMESNTTLKPEDLYQGENSHKMGVLIKNDYDRIQEVSPNSAILLSAHAKKEVAKMSYAEIEKSEMVSLIRGHGSIVGEACNSGWATHKEFINQEKEPTRFSIIQKNKRTFIHAKSMLIEFKEESADGWARLERIDNSLMPPTKHALELYRYFSELNASQAAVERNSQEICRIHRFYSGAQCLAGVEELELFKVIERGVHPQSWILSKDESKISKYYLDYLKRNK